MKLEVHRPDQVGHVLGEETVARLAGRELIDIALELQGAFADEFLEAVAMRAQLLLGVSSNGDLVGQATVHGLEVARGERQSLFFGVQVRLFPLHRVLETLAHGLVIVGK